jgi:hypothetical protein
VLNEDIVQPGQGFGTHPHADMESWPGCRSRAARCWRMANGWRSATARPRKTARA